MRPILVPEDIRNGNAARAAAVASIARACVAHALAIINKTYADEIVNRQWQHDRTALGLINRAASPPATTTSASAVTQTLIADFLRALSPVSAGASLFAQSLRLSFGRAAFITLPTFIADATAAAFVGQG